MRQRSRAPVAALAAAAAVAAVVAAAAAEFVVARLPEPGLVQLDRFLHWPALEQPSGHASALVLAPSISR